jgi:hypothetical protein
MLAHKPAKHQTWHACMLLRAVAAAAAHLLLLACQRVHGIVALVILSRHVSAPRQQQLQAGQVVLLSSLQKARTGKDIWAG